MSRRAIFASAALILALIIGAFGYFGRAIIVTPVVEGDRSAIIDDEEPVPMSEVFGFFVGFVPIDGDLRYTVITAFRDDGRGRMCYQLGNLRSRFGPVYVSAARCQAVGG